MTDSFADDLATIAEIDAVTTILEVVCRTTGMGFAAVARVTDDRWIACAVRDEIDFGLKPGGELAVETTICNEIRASGKLVVIDHVAEDKAFCLHPTPKMYGFQSYISVPIHRGGRFFGTLCAIDPRPARLDTPETIGMFKLFSDLIGFHLDAHASLAASRTALAEERHGADLREQFIAVLGHDLRNPLNAIGAGAHLLLKTPLDESAVRVVHLIQSSVSRMSGLIENVLDFARARLGGGLTVTRAPALELGSMLEQVIAELQAVWPERVIDSDLKLDRVVSCDPGRIARLLSNLLANALMHGDRASPVRVRAESDDKVFELSVANSGEPISAEVLERLFQPFSRSSDQRGAQGLGLGLFIADRIAHAHDGSLDVSSSAAETRFTFRMPISPA